MAFPKTVYSFDTETTAANPAEARILTAGLTRVTREAVERAEEWVINPGVPIPEESTKIHGMTEEWIKENGKDGKAVLAEVSAFIVKILKSRSPLIIFNAPYDLTVLELETKRYGLPSVLDQLTEEDLAFILDPMVLGKGALHQLKREFKKGQKFSLPALCERFGVEFEETHGATPDSIGAARLMLALVDDVEQFQEFTPDRFLLYQRNWRAEQQNSLREYFDRMKIEHDGVDPAWPFYESLIQA